MTVQRSRVEVVLVLVTMLFASERYCVAQQAAISGVVRDASGVAQLGVLVQITAADSRTVARAFTDLTGHYLVTHLNPGHYQVQATAALFAPAMKANLLLHSGARTVVNLTMSSLFDTTAWLPAERRKSDEPTDDWKWTLRSAANRPILRMVEDGELVMVSSSLTESHASAVSGRATMTSGDGGFGRGGVHSVLTMDSVQADGLGAVLRVDTGSGRTQSGVAPSTELSAGFERKTGFATTVRAVTSFQSHPEFISAGNAPGLQAMELATAQRTKLGDLISLEAGGVISAVHTVGHAFTAQPFLRVMVQPGAVWSFGYRMATSRDLQGFSGLNAVQPEVPVAVMNGKDLRTVRGRHQEILAGHKLGRGQVQAAVYKDTLERVVLQGGGALTSGDLRSLSSAKGHETGGIADSLTDSFRLLTSGYQVRGVNLMMTQPLGATMWAAVEYSTGAGLSSGPSADNTASSLPTVVNGLRVRSSKTATVALKGTLPGTGTRLRAVYRWQPRDLLTPVDPYREFSDQAYFSFHLRQPVRWEGVFPPGLEASVDVTNLLAQGYQPFFSSDGRTLYLAQTPRTLQAGLSINF